MVQLRKALAMTVPVGASTTITVLVGALLPGPVGFTLFVGGLAVAAVLALGIREDLAAAVLLRARPLTPGEEAALAPAVTLLCRRGCGPPLIRLRVRPDRAEVAASGAGRSTVVLSGGLVAAVRDGVLPVEEAAAVIAHAASLVRAGLTRMDLFLGFWTIPWRLLHGLAEGVAAIFGRLPGVRLVWRGTGLGVGDRRGPDVQSGSLADRGGDHRSDCPVVRHLVMALSMGDAVTPHRGRSGQGRRVRASSCALPAPVAAHASPA